MIWEILKIWLTHCTFLAESILMELLLPLGLALTYLRMGTSNELLEVLMHFLVLLYYVLYHFPCFLILLQGSFYENVSLIARWDLFLGNLNSSSTLQLKIPYGFTSFTDYQPHTFVRNWDYVGLFRENK